MTKVILDAALRAKLNGLQSQLELCDESGHTLGYFVPAGNPGVAATPLFHSPISAQEIERRRKETGGRTLAEIWASLGDACHSSEVDFAN
jgi:hypothetical protein